MSDTGTRSTYGEMVQWLDSLPSKSVVLDFDEDAWQKDDDGLWNCTVRVDNTSEMSAQSVALMAPFQLAYRGADQHD